MTAHDVLAAGLAVLPIDPDTKRPPVMGSERYAEQGGYAWKAFQTVLPSAGAVAAFLRRYPECWLGFACGAGSGGIEVLDFDIPGKKGLAPGEKGAAPAWEPWRESVRAAGLGELLDRLTVVETRSGGRQVYYRCSTPSGNSKLANRPPTTEELRADPKAKAQGLIETRGAGGLVVCPPSTGYAFLQGGFETIPTISDEERGALWALACALDETPPEPERSARASKPRRDREARPGDDFDDRASWDEILEPHGYRRVGRTFAGGMQLWAHSGKAKGDWSARTGEGRAGDRFYSWSTNGGVPANRLLTKFGLFAYLEHGGDFEAAARDLGRRGYGSPARSREPRTRADESEGDLDPSPIAKDLDVGAGFMRNDLGNARRLVHFHGADLRYCQEWGRFLHFDDSVWVQDSEDNARARLLAHDVSDGMLRSPDEETRKWGNKSQSSGALSSMLREAQPLVGVRSRDLDTHDHLLGVGNGVLDLRTGRLVGNTRELLITKRADAVWDPDATCPLFETFLRQIMRDRKDLVGLMLRVLGYCLTGSTREQKFFLFYGARGRNGKTTLVELMQALLGEELCGPINKRLLTASDKDSARFAMAAIEGKRVVFANETTRAKAVDTEWIKEFAGGSTVQAERKGRDEYKFKPKAKLLHSVNAMPSADWSSSYGSRAVPIPFEQSWYRREDPNWREGDFEPDERLDEKLRAELPGILALLVNHGSVPWFEEGLVIPPAVATLLERYRMENDHLGHWMAERCKAGPTERVGMQEAFADFRDFMKASGVPYRGRINDFQADVLARPGIEHKRPGNRSTVVGLSIRPDEYDAEEEG